MFMSELDVKVACVVSNHNEFGSIPAVRISGVNSTFIESTIIKVLLTPEEQKRQKIKEEKIN